jgi:hypothetical protein
MIIRILSEGQYDVPDAEVDGLNELDGQLETLGGEVLRVVVSARHLAGQCTTGTVSSKCRRSGERPSPLCRPERRRGFVRRSSAPTDRSPDSFTILSV